MKKAYNTALKLINIKPRTSKEMEKKLQEKKFDSDIISQVIDKLKEYNFINDMEYADNYVKYLYKLKKKGRFHIINKLREKGIDKDITDEALSSYPEEEEYNISLELAKSKLGAKVIDDKQVGKLTSFLRSRGFPEDIIYRVIKKIRFGE
ncbi:MAG: regulatory protein RecX [Armatimonadota bacterium]